MHFTTRAKCISSHDFYATYRTREGQCPRLALKAQSQSGATVETLVATRDPRVVFARHANINNGGQQQVNNGAAPVVAGMMGRMQGGRNPWHRPMR